MYIRNEDYMRAVNEFFDPTDVETRRILLTVNEADKNQILVALTSKLYDHIIDKVDDIDFGQIPSTKGDITKLTNYEDMLDCVQVIKDLLVEYKQSTDSIDTIVTAIENIKRRKDIFEKGFRYNVEFPIVMYSTIVLSIVSSISLLITSSIEFIKSPNRDTFDLMVDKVGLGKTKDSLLFKDLVLFNKSCSNGQIDESLEFIIKKNIRNLTGLEPIVIAGAMATITIIFNIIPIIRELVYFFYYSRTRISDYLEIQAELLEMNAYTIEHNENIEEEERKTISRKQNKIAEKLRAISNKLAVKLKKAENETSKEISNSNKKMKTSDVLDEIPNSADMDSGSIF